MAKANNKWAEPDALEHERGLGAPGRETGRGQGSDRRIYPYRDGSARCGVGFPFFRLVCHEAGDAGVYTTRAAGFIIDYAHAVRKRN